MDFLTVALWLASQGAAIIEKGRELWQSQGKDPDAYDSAVAAAREARRLQIEQQRSAELDALGGK